MNKDEKVEFVREMLSLCLKRFGLKLYEVVDWESVRDSK